MIPFQMAFLFTIHYSHSHSHSHWVWYNFASFLFCIMIQFFFHIALKYKIIFSGTFLSYISLFYQFSCRINHLKWIECNKKSIKSQNYEHWTEWNIFSSFNFCGKWNSIVNPAAKNFLCAIKFYTLHHFIVQLSRLFVHS